MRDGVYSREQSASPEAGNGLRLTEYELALCGIDNIIIPIYVRITAVIGLTAGGSG